MIAPQALDEMLRGYLVCALWSSAAGIRFDEHGTIVEDPDNGLSFFDHNFGLDDVAELTRIDAYQDVCGFVFSNIADVFAYGERQEYDPSQGTVWDYFGHDFWLTRNGHGAGFWDRGLGELGERFTRACRPFGEVNLYVTDDGRIAV